MPKKIELDTADLCLIYSNTPVPGTGVLYVLHPCAPMPIAHLYFRQVMVRQTEILDIQVYAHFRRMGIAGHMLASLCIHVPGHAIMTESANAESEPWLLKHGFKKTPIGWVLPFGVEKDKPAPQPAEATVEGRIYDWPQYFISARNCVFFFEGPESSAKIWRPGASEWEQTNYGMAYVGQTARRMPIEDVLKMEGLPVFMAVPPKYLPCGCPEQSRSLCPHGNSNLA